MILFLETEEVPLHAERTHQQVPVMPFPAPRVWVPSEHGAGDLREGDFSGTSRHKESLSSRVHWLKHENQVPLLGLQAKVGLVLGVDDKVRQSGKTGRGRVPW